MADISQENLEIKDIPDVPQPILYAAESGKLVVFIGAGVSRILGCPAWDELAHYYLKVLYDKKAINYHEYWNLKSLKPRMLLSICKQIYRIKNLPLPDIREILKGDEELLQRYSLYEDLYNFNAIFVSTNYDTLLDEVAEETKVQLPTFTQELSPNNIFEKREPKGKVFYLKEDLLISNLDNGNIIHLHGSIRKEETVIMTITDYIQHYEINGKPAILLKEIFDNHTVLFIGYGLEELEILEFMIRKSQGDKKVIRHFMLYPVFKREVNLLNFHQNYYIEFGIQLIPYPIDETGYEQLASVIKEWSKRIGPISKPKNFYEKIKLIDKVVS